MDDRVMVYRFDNEWNGEVLAEDVVSTLEPFLGLRFPHWDIPVQAREIMKRIELRMIVDSSHEPVRVVQDTPDLPPLDLTLADLRGASEVHLQYLRNMGTGATLTLSVVVGGELWGMISFHHQRAKYLPFELRQILIDGVLPIFTLKLEVMRNQAALDLSRKIDALQGGIKIQLERDTDFDDVLDDVGDVICSALDASGLAIISGEHVYIYGKAPPTEAVLAIGKAAIQSEDQPYATSSFAAEKLGFGEAVTGGVLAIAPAYDRALLIFRPEIRQTLNWAGDPDKKIEIVDDRKRLTPRGSFKTYLEEHNGHCKDWSDQDRHLAAQLWPLLSALERQDFMKRIARQQELMIGELNHRVRNILALVKSVSTQARKEGGSLESFGQALEARIYALAAAHDIGAGVAVSAVPFSKIIALETNPFRDDDRKHVRVSGVDFSINAEFSPIFALAIHELMTNAVKYGALSASEGHIEIESFVEDDGVTVTWSEHGGPKVNTPNREGFGTTLIRQAVPFELKGKSELEYRPSGVFARLWLPTEVLLQDASTGSLQATSTPAPKMDRVIGGTALVVEDNFVIGSDLKSDVTALGFSNVDLFAGEDGAMAFLDVERPSIAILDYSLGREQTSEAIAIRLQDMGVPFLFVSGHGERIRLDPRLEGAAILTKPLLRTELQKIISRLMD